MTAAHIRIGVFMPNGAQTLDMATIDILGVMSKEYFSATSLLPAHIAAIAPNVSVYYITTPTTGKDIPLTSDAIVKASHYYTDEAVAPGKLDIIMVPGPNPESEYEEGGLAWLKAQSDNKGVDILCVCTGMYVCASAGIVDGKMASGPRGMQGDLKKKFPKIKLVGDNQRWARDGNFWSSGGITNGNDLMAAYAAECGRWPQPVVEMGLMMTEVSNRGQFYETSSQVFMLGAAWSIIKAWFVSLGGSKKNLKTV